MMKHKTIGVKKMETTSGNLDMSVSELFEKQIDFQKSILAKQGEIFTANAIPTDNLQWFTYHCLAMIEEMGEVMKADKRWKTHRNYRFEREEKLDEIADVFITAINIAIYSGFSGNDIQEAIDKKICKNIERVSK